MYIESMKERKIENIPQGIYCWDSDGTCPYWSIQKDKPHQENGFCHFLHKGDGSFEHFSMLFDQVKECNVFQEINEYELSIKNPIQCWLKKFSLFGTIPKHYNIFERIRIMWTGKICRCKFCNQYFIQPADANNLTQCTRCFFKRVRKGKGA